MVFRENRLPAITREERDGLIRLCEAMCRWIDAAERPDRQAVHAFYALYDECHDERYTVVRACTVIRRAVFLRNDTELERNPLFLLVEAITGLVNVEYGRAVGSWESASTTVEGDGEVRLWGAHVERAHRAFRAALTQSHVTADDRQAVGAQSLGFCQLVNREPYHAWISFNAAVIAWKGKGPADSDSTDLAEEVRPEGCLRCFRNPDILAGLSTEVYRRTATLVAEPHLGVHLAECVHCCQLSVQIFEENVDWRGGDDAQRYEMIALTRCDHQLLLAADRGEVRALARRIGLGRMRLWWDWPTGRMKTVGRTVS